VLWHPVSRCNAHPHGFFTTPGVVQAFAAIKEAHGKQPATEPHRSLHFHFLQTPYAIDKGAFGAVAGVQLYESHMCTDATGSQTLERTGRAQALKLDMLLKSVGYRAAPLPGVPFDEQHAVIPNSLGRVVASVAHDADVVSGLYTCGWVKRGPTGIVGTNVVDAEQTAGCVAEDAKAGRLPAGEGGGDALAALLQVRSVQCVCWLT
jgi:NADPH-dependent glutamate synthase beta subunit-like oxidoreductase